MNPRRKILVVDDEPQIGRVLRTSLSSRGYDVRVASDGESAMDVFSAWSPDLVITDLSMPNVTGVELCRRLRESSQVPIIVLSVKGEEHTKIEALDSGADDYVTKPFSINELLARIRAGLRRTVPEKEAELPEIISIGDFFIDRQKRIVTVRGKEIRLTPKEFDLLVCMASHPGQVLRHRALLNDVWGGQSVEQPEYLRVFINQLRKKIEPEDTPRYILTEPWVGYRFQPE
ncbi:MAG TPA: response regulator transcription factor [Candidatus Angelobacter sp.]|nr:response regulator transcription factor [Candidatus Angelobacter sp.]